MSYDVCVCVYQQGFLHDQKAEVHEDGNVSYDVCVSIRFSTPSERGGSSRWECVSYGVCVCVCINKVFRTIREGWFMKLEMCVL